MFLEILLQNSDGTLVENESGQAIVTGLVNLEHVSRIYVGQHELPGGSSNLYHVIAFIPGSIEQHRNTVSDATNKKVLFFGSQESCENYLHTLNQDLRRNDMTLKSPAIRLNVTVDKAKN